MTRRRTRAVIAGGVALGLAVLVVWRSSHAPARPPSEAVAAPRTGGSLAPATGATGASGPPILPHPEVVPPAALPASLKGTEADGAIAADELSHEAAMRAACASGIDDAERRRRIDDLLARSFTPSERIRVEALDRLAPGPSGP